MLNSDTKYKIKIVRGAFIDPSVLDNLGAVVIEKVDDADWQSIDELTVTLDQIKELQKSMIKHPEGNTAPWYLDGYNLLNKNNHVVAFGSDDGEGGRLYVFDREDRGTVDDIVQYGLSKCIPLEQLDFDLSAK